MMMNDDVDDDDDGEQDDDDGGSHLNRVCVPVLRLLLRLQVWRHLTSLKQNRHLRQHHLRYLRQHHRHLRHPH